MNDGTMHIVARVVAELHVENELLRQDVAELTRLLEQARSLAATMALHRSYSDGLRDAVAAVKLLEDGKEFSWPQILMAINAIEALGSEQCQD